MQLTWFSHVKSFVANPRTETSAELPRSARRLDTATDWFSGIVERHQGMVLVVFSVGYFALTCYRASRKLFWFDELFTVYLARLHDLNSVWRALMNGVDFNPPLFYVLTRFSEHILGEGPLGARLPAILGFWVFCLCMFRFISLRLSVLSACVSMVFPVVTGAYWYAYEARAHGIVLGFCGAALVSWQAAADHSARRGWWLFGLGGSLSCALLTHSYAFLIFAPIVLGELSRAMCRERPDWPLWTIIAISALPVLVSLPFVRNVVSGLGSRKLFAATLLKVILAYADLILPAAGVLVGWFVLTCLARKGREEPAGKSGLKFYESVALWTFLVIPALEYAAAKLTNAPFLSRYAISTIAGLAGLLGTSVSRKPRVAFGTILLLIAQISVAFFGFVSGSALTEPTSSYQIGTRIRQFSERYAWMSGNGTLPIVLLDDLDFMPTAYYVPADVAPQLVYVKWTFGDINGEGARRLRACCQSEPAVVGLTDFVASHDAFLVYGEPRSAYRLKYFVDGGAKVEKKRETNDHFLVLVTYPKKTVKESSR